MHELVRGMAAHCHEACTLQHEVGFLASYSPLISTIASIPNVSTIAQAPFGAGGCYKALCVIVVQLAAFLNVMFARLRAAWQHSFIH